MLTKMEIKQEGWSKEMEWERTSGLSSWLSYWWRWMKSGIKFDLRVAWFIKLNCDKASWINLKFN